MKKKQKKEEEEEDSSAFHFGLAEWNTEKF
jgi:hypothetical protein